jgi:hypothetical protein
MGQYHSPGGSMERLRIPSLRINSEAEQLKKRFEEEKCLETN